jgi:hypothetical protein
LEVGDGLSGRSRDESCGSMRKDVHVLPLAWKRGAGMSTKVGPATGPYKKSLILRRQHEPILDATAVFAGTRLHACEQSAQLLYCNFHHINCTNPWILTILQSSSSVISASYDYHTMIRRLTALQPVLHTCWGRINTGGCPGGTRGMGGGPSG